MNHISILLTFIIIIFANYRDAFASKYKALKSPKVKKALVNSTPIISYL